MPIVPSVIRTSPTRRPALSHLLEALWYLIFLQKIVALQQQINLVRTTRAEPVTLLTPTTIMNAQNGPPTERSETDTIMETGTTNQPQPIQTATTGTHRLNDPPPSHSSLCSNYYEDITDNEEEDVSWFTNVLEALDGRWNKLLSTVTAKLSHQESQTQKSLTELEDIKLLQQQEVARSKGSYAVTHEAVKGIAQKQGEIIETTEPPRRGRGRPPRDTS